MLSTLVERCLNSENKSEIQNDWNRRVAEEINEIASINPYLPDLPIGEEIQALEAVAWVNGPRRGVDCRPKVFDGQSRTWKLCDSGSMVTVIKKGPDDILDQSRILQAVNGSAIKCYGKKTIQIRLGRKTYEIDAIIADVNQDILGWDFLSKHKLNWEWSEFGDLFLIDKKAQSKIPVKFFTLPPDEV